MHKAGFPRAGRHHRIGSEGRVPLAVQLFLLALQLLLHLSDQVIGVRLLLVNADQARVDRHLVGDHCVQVRGQNGLSITTICKKGIIIKIKFLIYNTNKIFPPFSQSHYFYFI